MANFYDDELQKELSDYIAAGSVNVVEDASSFYQLVEEFPIQMNRIDWSKVKNHMFVDLYEIKEDERIAIVQSFIKEVQMQVDNQIVAVVGDGAQENAYVFELSLLSSLIMHFIDLPQHVFIMLKTSSACINVTFEGQLYFGYSKMQGEYE